MTTDRTLTPQIAIIGGGICGTWLLNQLRSSGYDAWLFEADALGAEQTLASQGMIHGGLKYALGGFKTAASETIANMPETWRQCLDGNGPVDLSGMDVLSDDYFLFSDGALTNKVTAFFASKSLKARIEAMKREDFPDAFKHETFQGLLYRLQDLVLDTPRLLARLLEPVEGYAFKGFASACQNDIAQHGLMVDGEHIKADHYIFCAGQGNASLLSGSAALTNVEMQRRPLQQVMLAGNLPPVYAHAVSLKSTNKPRVTITSHPLQDGRMVWYLGGDLAEKGVGIPKEELIARGKRELTDLMPWIDLTNTEWATLDVDRAEPAQAEGNRPDHPFVKTSGNCTVCWPTKLTLTPLLAQDVLAAMSEALSPAATSASQMPNLPLAQVGIAPWEKAFA